MHIAALRRRAHFGIAAMLTALLLALGLLSVPPAQAAADGGEVSDASLIWGLNGYAQKGIFGPWIFKDLTSDASLLIGSVSGGNQTEYTPTQENSSMPVSGTPNAIKFTAGSGTVSAATGEATLSWNGSYTVNAYPAGFNAPDEIYSDPQLTVDSAGVGTLTMEFTVGAGIDMAGNPTPEQNLGRLTLATLSGVSVSDSGFTVTPDYQGVTLDPAEVTQSTSCEGVWGAWPAEFVYAVPTSIQPHFYSTGCGGMQDSKPALPLQVSYTVETSTPIAESSLTVSKSSGLDPLGEEITVSGSGYTVDPAGVYAQVGWIKPGEWTPTSQTETRSENRVGVETAWVGGPGAQPKWTVAEDGTGSFSWTVTVTKSKMDEKAKAGFVLAAFTLGAHAKWVQPNNEHFVALSFAGASEPPVKPGTPPTTNPVAAGSLTWGVKESFRNYVTGPIAAGSISTTNARSTGSAFVFGQASGGTFNGSTGTSNYTGSVRFLGHGGILDLTLGNPVVRIDSASSGTLMMRVNGSTVPFATLALGSGSKSTSGGAVSYSRVPASLTSQGAAAFVNGDSQFYPAGTALDPISFVIGAPSSAGSGTRTVSAFVTPGNAVPPTPPASTGITLEGGDPGSVNEGDEVTITADGFEPNEQGIKVVIYSDPVVLATDASADAQGVVTWTGVLPAGLTGAHTLTLQGSVDWGIELTIGAAATTTFEGCVADAATLTWGFKEAFRSYISGTIANGEWTVADGAGYETPNFEWSDGEGNFDAESAEGLIAFAGSVQFTGHGGVLDTTIANPQLRFDGEGTATLLLDITGTTQAGEEVSATAVEFATVDLAAAEKAEADGQLSYTGAPAVLTPAGAEAFGTYPAGEALDPITVAFSGECATLATEAAPADDAAGEVTDSGTGPSWLIWAILAALLVAAAITTAVVVARRRATA